MAGCLVLNYTFNDFINERQKGLKMNASIYISISSNFNIQVLLQQLLL